MGILLIRTNAFFDLYSNDFNKKFFTNFCICKTWGLLGLNEREKF